MADLPPHREPRACHGSVSRACPATGLAENTAHRAVAHIADSSGPDTRRTRRPATLGGSIHPRIVATVALLPFGLGIEIPLVFMYAYYSSRVFSPAGSNALAQVSLMAMICVPAVVFYGGALAIWWPTVRWTPARQLAAVMATGVLGAAVVVGMLVSGWFMSAIGMLATAVACVVGGSVAMVILYCVCWSPPVGSGGPSDVRCLECLYDMRGQHECRCPECGASFTVAELLCRGDYAPPIGLDWR